MTARIRRFLADLQDVFWLLPGAMVLTGIAAAVLFLHLDRIGAIPRGWIDSYWLYSGGGTGARTLLGAVASSTIGVAGTVFSITIAALSLAAGQMGPRLLRNFTRDRGNQLTLGAFLGTFAYTLTVLRAVRTQSEGAFVPHLSLTVSMLLAFVCVGTLVFFVGHMAGRINVDTVIELVSEDVRTSMRRLLHDQAGAPPPDPGFWADGAVIADPRHGYLQQLHEQGLADWAAEHHACIRLLVRPGDYVFPGAPIAIVVPPIDGVDAAVRDATALGAQRISAADLEYSIRQLVEVAVRALSPGINDPHTAMSVLDRLASALCEVVPLYLPSGVETRDGRPALVVPPFDYDGLVDAMFHMIRQNAAGSAAVLIRLMEVLTSVISVEAAPDRVRTLARHADLVLGDAERDISTPADLDDLRRRHARFTRVREDGGQAFLGG